VLQEFYLTLTRELTPAADPVLARDDVAALATWGPVATDLEVMESAWRIEDRFMLSWWDSLIVAQALASGSETILTEDLPHGQDLFGVRVVDPFQIES
jgi:predicted nucleic acid-binding protein